MGLNVIKKKINENEKINLILQEAKSMKIEVIEIKNK